MATLYNVNKNFQGINSFGTNFCDESYSATLAANTDTSLTVPSNSAMGFAGAQTNPTFLAVFHYAVTTPVDVYVALNTAAAAPAGGSFAATASVLNPTAKVVKAGDVIHFKCVAGGVVTVEFFSTQEN
jgi:hypothetical protein